MNGQSRRKKLAPVKNFLRGTLAMALVLLLGLPVITLGAEGSKDATSFGLQPPEKTSSPVSEQELKEALVKQKQGLCSDLELLAGIIISTGILGEVPSTISDLTGMPVDQMEKRETGACQGNAAAGEKKTTAELLNEVRTVQWLLRAHLVAMDRVLMQDPEYRPVNAEGAFKAFFNMHDITVRTMRENYLALVNEPTLEEAKAMGAFWQESIIPHARAEEASLFPLAQKVGGEKLSHSAKLVEQEHQMIDRGIKRYMETLSEVEKGKAPLRQLIPIAHDIRLRTELHFGKEEQSVVRLLQERISPEQFRVVPAEFNERMGEWLQEHGWQWAHGG